MNDSDTNIMRGLESEMCDEWRGSVSNDGYGYLYVDGKYVLAHRLAYCEANGLDLSEIDGMVVRHTCDWPPCVKPEHLVLGTNADNVADRVARNRSARQNGTNNGRAILDDEIVAQIRSDYRGPQPGNNQRRPRTGPTQIELAEKYGVTRSAIASIVRGRTWSS